MTLYYKKLSSGYHYVRAICFHHLFAQWPMGEQLKPQHISANMKDHPVLISKFMQQAQELADQSV